MANLLTSLFKKDPKCLSLNPATGEAFVRLKTAFTTASILENPDPSTSFVVEIDASESGLRAVLSQHLK